MSPPGFSAFTSTASPLTSWSTSRPRSPTPPPEASASASSPPASNPADWALTTGFLPGPLPRGIGCDVAGVVESIGEGVDSVKVGDRVFGAADLTLPSAGAADLAILNDWVPLPVGLDPVKAATLPMVATTTEWTLDLPELESGATLLINGAGGMVGYAMVQIALRRGFKVIATAGPALTPDIEGFGAQVTTYGDGVVERVRALIGGPDVDFVLDASRSSLGNTSATGEGSLRDLVALAGGDPARVMTISNHGEARELGVRINLDALGTVDLTPAREVYGKYGALMARSELRLPIARTFPFDEWRDAVELLLSGNPHGKIVLLAPTEASA